MPAEIADLIERLRAMSTDISGWRDQITTLRAASRTPEAGSDDKLLLTVEETSGRIYDGISEFDALVVDIDKTSHDAAAQIVEVGDALRLLLMEITELGTQLYALRSAPPSEEDGTAIAAIGPDDPPPAGIN